MEAFLTILHAVAAVLIIGVVLIQKDRGGGLVGALAGGAGGSPFGIKTAGVLIKITSVLFAIFVLSALILTRMGGASHRSSPDRSLPSAPSDDGGQ